eukprot:4874293-Amphidinium_carterae.1
MFRSESIAHCSPVPLTTTSLLAMKVQPDRQACICVCRERAVTHNASATEKSVEPDEALLVSWQ